MKHKHKIALIVSAIAILDYIYGFDARFTIINLVWCIPSVIDWTKEKSRI